MNQYDNKDIIHIGMPKTATTWFQKYFYPNIENRKYIDRNIISELFIKPRAFDFDKNYVLKKMKSIEKDKSLIICDEVLSGALQSGALHGYMTKENAIRLKQVFPEAHIVIFIREQKKMIASMYQQYIKIGGNYSINEYLHHSKFHPLRTPLFELDFLNYYKIIDFYIQLFGKDNISIFLYEEFLENQKEFIKNYQIKFNLEVEFEKINFSTTNTSYKKTTTKIAKILNIFSKLHIQNKYYIFHIEGFFEMTEKLLKLIDKSKWGGNTKMTYSEILTQKEITKIDDFYKTCNIILRDRYMLNVEKYGYST
ncbi:hypothetical protein Q6A86_09040 [Aliarcobacter skirrowii]|uniref:hypothetical protein n=1 Tax=Aliarcobacter skirrowii TaxID=28200 RepID=UPI0029B7E526|nr:hypothetical protein [Aliarcobacter skirrowii]MDX4013130.1 hypothetical protein [Aliarcobacter skirrowii]